MNEETIGEVFEGLSADMRDYYISPWREEGRGEELEAQVVKLADKLSLVSKCAEEVRAGQERDKPWWQKIKPRIL